jgi:hypothetical protein
MKKKIFLNVVQKENQRILLSKREKGVLRRMGGRTAGLAKYGRPCRTPFF